MTLTEEKRAVKSIYLLPDMIKLIETMAKKEKRSFNAMVEILLTETLEVRESKTSN
jgi:hypothetical protein